MALRIRPPMSSSASSHDTCSHSPLAALALAPQRIEDPIRILELVGRDHALGAGPAAAAGMDGFPSILRTSSVSLST